MSEEVDFEKELNELFDIQDRIMDVAKQIQLDILVFGEARLPLGKKKKV